MKPTFGETQLMLTQSYKKLSQATAGIALGAAMLATVVNAPAQAVTLKTFNISGEFAPQAISGSTGVAVDLQNGSFFGTYTVDIDQLPTATSISLNDWSIVLKDASNNILRTFSSSLLGHTGQIMQNNLLFSNNIGTSEGEVTESFGLKFPSGFTGLPMAVASSGRFSSVIDINDNLTAGRIGITSATVVPVPEPVSTAGVAVAGVVGLWMKRKQKATIA
ncbi:PEP-CTERM sorting domain-containing protein [Nostoc spongiaeforme FACHB-130]|uniref:PEP-CTERM sorting domain-containing protein n=1 Tax=Nostoc spongiaeforme FACHB-130 TaxID=1357510 RepID=A0ABR8FS47_9NOSO|nr:PEP-CTERM sorting domain-containing protein [Nostoc spongiaeforme]MBD2593765.1 PEP-CTERM sorting domain-containing protein [Nostoc spongiaeforme FACHB-130]